jgi:hypothetical protein
MSDRGSWLPPRAHVYGLGVLLGVLWSISTTVVVATLPNEVDEVPLVAWSFTLLPVLSFVAGILATIRPPARILPWGPRWLAAAEAGAVVAFIGFGLHDLTYAVAQNAFFATFIKQNPDLVAAFPSSGFSSLPVFATVKTAELLIPLLIAHSLLGTICGAIGGLLARLVPVRRQPVPPAAG